MSQPSTCHHVLANGALCQASPLRNRDYCRFHLQQIGRRMKAARTRARNRRPALKLPLLEDLYSVQIALMQLADAIAYQEIEPQYARLLTTVLRLAMQNLKGRQPWENSQRFQAAVHAEGYPTTWDSFEQEHDLPPDLDLALDPEVAFPPPANTAPEVCDHPLGANLDESNYRAGAPLNPAAGLTGDGDAMRARIGAVLREAEKAPLAPITADHVELMEVLELEGNEAMIKRASEHLRNQRRRERRARRVYYEQVAHNRNVQAAAELLFEEHRKSGTIPPPAPPTRKSVLDEVAQVEADFKRKSPRSEAATQSQNAVTAEA